MKQFFGAFFGSILGIIIASIISVLIIVGIVSSSIDGLKNDSEEEVQKVENAVLKLELNGTITDRSKEEDPLSELKSINPLASDEGGSEGLNSLIKKINHAKTDEAVKGIYLHFTNVEAGFATIEELRNALLEFKKSGKFVYAYSEAYSQKDYYLASASTKIFLHPQGGFEWKGLGASLLFFKNAFDKYGLDVQVFRHGKFKSAVEPYLYSKMSSENRYQTETFLNSIWNSMLVGVSETRKISVNELNNMANNLKIAMPEDALGKFVDVLAYEDEVQTEIKKQLKLKETDKINYLSFNKYKIQNSETSTDKIAVVYALGSIESGQGDDETIGSERIAKAICDAKTNDKVKAIVLRVNSPGGSALASDVIWREVVLAKKKKPVIVSMGDLAASGGYYISCAADYIFAQPNTISGSIGVFGMMPNFKKALEQNFGITLDTVNTNKHSDFGSGLRPTDKEEFDFVQKGVEKVYDVFTNRVAEGRGITQAEVDSIGQGRVWSGTDAMNIKLVDAIGGLNDAIAYAAKKAKLSKYKILELPKQTNPLDKWLGNKEKDVETKILKSNLGVAYPFIKSLNKLIKTKGVQARMPFELVWN